MLAAKDQRGYGTCTIKVLGHVVAGQNVVVGCMDSWDGLCEWVRRRLGLCMLVSLDHGIVCCREGPCGAQDAFQYYWISACKQ
jgi:hypothetical protein